MFTEFRTMVLVYSFFIIYHILTVYLETNKLKKAITKVILGASLIAQLIKSLRAM